MSEPEEPSPEELEAMTAEEAMIVGAATHGVHVVHRRSRFPVPGTHAERRAERGVSLCFILGALAGVAFIVVFIVVPWQYQLPGGGKKENYLYTPFLGVTLGLMLLFLGAGAVLWAKWLMPEEEVVQERHDDPPSESDKIMTAATISVGLADTGLPRRSMLLRSLGLAGGALAAVPLVALVGALIKRPGSTLDHTWFGMEQQNYPNGVPIIYADGRRCSPNDMEPGSLVTVFPAGHVREASSPTIIIRLRPGEVVKARKGQQNWNFGDFVAFSKICTHAGCPASLYEQQTTRLLCPCHQSQFEVLRDAEPVFGPATRSLPKLKLDVEVVDGVQYFVAKQDYQEPVGPGFWERSGPGSQ